MGSESTYGSFRTYPCITDSIDRCLEVADKRAAKRMVDRFSEERKRKHLREILSIGLQDDNTESLISYKEMKRNATSLILKHYETLKLGKKSCPSVEFDASKRPEEAYGIKNTLEDLYLMKINGASNEDLEEHLNTRAEWKDPYQKAWILVHIVVDTRRCFRSAGNFAQIMLAHFSNLYDHGVLKKAFPDIAEPYRKPPVERPKSAVA